MDSSRLDDLRDLTDGISEAASLGTNALWLMCRDLPIGGGGGCAAIVAALLGGNADLVTLSLPAPGGAPLQAFYLSTMTDPELLSQGLIGGISSKHPIGTVGSVSTPSTFEGALQEVLAGQVLLLGSQGSPALLLDARGYKTRDIEQPVLETVVRGPHAAFTEDLETNVSLIRRRLRDPRLTFEPMTIGALSRTEVRLCYIRGLTNDRIVNEARRRLNAMSIATVVDSNYIEEQIQDDPYSLFPQIDFTERPDIVTAGLNEGRFAILSDGSNAALVAPVGFWSFMQAADDYYQYFYAGTFLRLLRQSFLFIALVMPALYIALTTYNQQMIPTPLLLSLMRAHIGVPFPALVEALVMEISFEILREAGLHLPQKLGTSLSVVGALIIGQAVVASGLVSWPVVLVVAITAIANFAIPRWGMALAIRFLRFGEMIAAALFGLPGIVVVTALIQINLLSLRSFGLPYFAPLAPIDPQGMEDVLMRMPHWSPHPRPRLLAPGWRMRVRPGRRPHPPAHGGTIGRDPRTTRGAGRAPYPR